MASKRRGLSLKQPTEAPPLAICYICYNGVALED
jgi:hypothetical protein